MRKLLIVFILIVLGLIPLCNAQVTGTFGTTTDGGSNAYFDPWFANKYVLSTNAKLLSLNLLSADCDEGGEYKIALYKGTASYPTTLIAYGSITGQANTWLSVNVSAYLEAGTYWIVVGSNQAGAKIRYSATGGECIKIAGTYANDYPNPFTVGGSSYTYKTSAYASYISETPNVTSTDYTLLYTIMIMAIICLNLLVGWVSKGWVVPATFGIISISIVIATLFSSIYQYILFSPWLQLILLCVAIFNLYGVILVTRK